MAWKFPDRLAEPGYDTNPFPLIMNTPKPNKGTSHRAFVLFYWGLGGIITMGRGLYQKASIFLSGPRGEPLRAMCDAKRRMQRTHDCGLLGLVMQKSDRSRSELMRDGLSCPYTGLLIHADL